MKAGVGWDGLDSRARGGMHGEVTLSDGMHVQQCGATLLGLTS